MQLSEQTRPELRHTEQSKDMSKRIHILIWQGQMAAWVSGPATSREVREVNYGSAPSLTQLGKTQIKDEVGVRATDVWEGGD